MRTYRINIPLLAISIMLNSFLCGCQSYIGSNPIEAVADSFATHYFNYELEECRLFCTPESEKWLSFVASNVHQADIDLLNQQEEGATIEILNADELLSDELQEADVRIKVHHFMQLGAIGSAAKMIDEAEFTLKAVKSNDQWLIKMAFPPQSERQSHDQTSDE